MYPTRQPVQHHGYSMSDGSPVYEYTTPGAYTASTYDTNMYYQVQPQQQQPQQPHATSIPMPIPSETDKANNPYRSQHGNANGYSKTLTPSSSVSGSGELVRSTDHGYPRKQREWVPRDAERLFEQARSTTPDARWNSPGTWTPLQRTLVVLASTAIFFTLVFYMTWYARWSSMYKDSESPLYKSYMDAQDLIQSDICAQGVVHKFNSFCRQCQEAKDLTAVSWRSLTEMRSWKENMQWWSDWTRPWEWCEPLKLVQFYCSTYLSYALINSPVLVYTVAAPFVFQWIRKWFQ